MVPSTEWQAAHPIVWAICCPDLGLPWGAASVGGTGVLVGGTGVAVGGTGVAVAGTGVSVGGTAVSVGGTAVSVGGTAVAVGGTGVAVGGTGVAVGGTGVGGTGVAVAAGGTGVDVGVESSPPHAVKSRVIRSMITRMTKDLRSSFTIEVLPPFKGVTWFCLRFTSVPSKLDLFGSGFFEEEGPKRRRGRRPAALPGLATWSWWGRHCCSTGNSPYVQIPVRGASLLSVYTISSGIARKVSRQAKSAPCAMK